MVATPHANCYFTGALNLYKTNDALLYQFMEVHMQMGLVRAKWAMCAKAVLVR